MNISSRSTDPFFAALTNPTELARRKGNVTRAYSLIDKNGRVWRDAEAAYKAYKSGDTPRDEQLMVRIIALKLKQHPCLVDGIKARGGTTFLESCNHLVGVKGSRWEGSGRDSRFIRCLIAAFETVLSAAAETSNVWTATREHQGMPSYFALLVMNVVVDTDSPEEAEALAPRLAEDKLTQGGVDCLTVQTAEEAQDNA